MGILKNLFTFHKRASNPFEDPRYWGDIGVASSTGLQVTPDTAKRCSAVFGCVRVLSETIAHLPFVLYKKGGDSRKRETSHPLYELLHDVPNRWQTSFEFREMLMGHVLLRGNGYAQKVYDRRGAIAELVPLNPTRVTPRLQPDGNLLYEFNPQQGGKVVLPASDVFHLKANASDGITGVSPIAEAREAVALALAAEEFGARTFYNDAQPGGVLEHPGKLGEEALTNLRSSIQQQHTGVQNARKWMILEEGMKWTKIGMDLKDTQFIEVRKFQIEEIARIFRVPPHLIGHLDRATFSNIEHQGLEFVTHTVLPWLKRWEQAIALRLMTPRERKIYYSEFLVDGLLRGDITSRYQAYAVGRQWGWLSADDVRKLENMDVLPEGQGAKYLLPLNMIDATELDDYLMHQNNPEPKTQAEDDVEDSLEDDSSSDSSSNEEEMRAFQGKEAFLPVISSVIDRYQERIYRSKKPFSEHREVILEGLTPVIKGLLTLNNAPEIEQNAVKIAQNFIDSWVGDPLMAEDLALRVVEGVRKQVFGEI